MTTDEQKAALAKQEKIENAKKYFLITCSNYFKSNVILLENRTTSYRILANEMITVYDEINKAKNEVEKSRLNKAFRYLLEEFNQYLESNLIFKQNTWNKEFTQIHNLLLQFIKLTGSSKISKQDDYREYGKTEEELLYKLVTSLRSLLKKVDPKQFAKSHFDLILSQEDPLSFDQVDIIVHSLFNELLCVHSVTFLKRNMEYTLSSTKFDLLDEKMIKLRDTYLDQKFTMYQYEFLVRLGVTEEINASMYLETEDILISKNQFQNMNIETTNVNLLKHLFPITKTTYLLPHKITAADDYKASELLEDNVNRFIEVYQLLSYKKEMVRGNKGLVKVGDKEWEFADLFISNRAVTVNKSKREEEDIKAFITLRNRRLGQNEMGNDLFLMERAYSLININNSMTPENQLLNAWLAMEHVVAPYNKEAIIEKIRQVISKVVSLYYVKQKMNEVWLELNRFASPTEYLTQFITACKKEEDWKYKKLEFANRLREVDEVNKLLDVVQHDISLKRRLMELNGLLCNSKQRKTKIEAVHQTIINDLNRIYRVRNKIVHSGTNIPENIGIITSRLIDYNQRLLGTIVHYMNKSNEITLEEVLNSIVETYRWYTHEDVQDLEEIITPNYLYL